MATDTHVEEELDMVVRHIKRRAQEWAGQTSPIGVVVSGELEGIAEEIEHGRHWEGE